MSPRAACSSESSLPGFGKIRRQLHRALERPECLGVASRGAQGAPEFEADHGGVGLCRGELGELGGGRLRIATGAVRGTEQQQRRQMTGVCAHDLRGRPGGCGRIALQQ